VVTPSPLVAELKPVEPPKADPQEDPDEETRIRCSVVVIALCSRADKCGIYPADACMSANLVDCYDVLPIAHNEMVACVEAAADYSCDALRSTPPEACDLLYPKPEPQKIQGI
jgi:hypothetical protein